MAGRTPIACQNCASAKTGCDRRVPCSRCAEKNLPCEARFARRSSKAAMRAAQASSTRCSQLPANSLPSQQIQVTGAPVVVLDRSGPNQLLPEEPRNTTDQTISLDPRLHELPQQRTSPAISNFSLSNFPTPHTATDSMEDFMQMGGNDLISSDATYQGILTWPDYPLEFDIYRKAFLGQVDMVMPAFTDSSDASSNAEQMGPSSSAASVHTRATSISWEFENPNKRLDLGLSGTADSPNAEIDVVMAAEAAWPLARCTPLIYSGCCPRTAIVHLESLEQRSKQEGTWNSLEKYLHQVDWDVSDLISIIPMVSGTRDKMLAITQAYLHKALEIHRGGVTSSTKGCFLAPGDFNFVVLPPPKILEYFFRSYIRSLSLYFPLVASHCFDPNEMLNNNNQASPLLLLLMIAQGAAAVPLTEGLWLSAGLMETCRISLFDVIEKDVELSADPIVLRSALLFTILGAWSGDKWQMDSAMGQRGMYLSVRNSLQPVFQDIHLG